MLSYVCSSSAYYVGEDAIFARVFLKPLQSAFFYQQFSPLGQISENADLGVLAKFVITQLYRHLWSRSLQQNVVLCLHFKWILIKR